MDPSTNPGQPAPLNPPAPVATPPQQTSGSGMNLKHISISALTGVVFGIGAFLLTLHFTGRRIVKRIPKD